MVSKTLEIKNPTGLHLRPAGILSKTAMEYKSMVTFKVHGDVANAKSILSILGSCVKCGDEVEFICEGADEEDALAAIVAAVEGGLGE